MKKTTVGFAMTGSFCTFDAVLAQMRELVRRDYDVIPILSYNAAQLDTRFMEAAQLHRELKSITGRDPIQTLQQAEPIGPKKLLDALVIAPCTGNTLAKLAHSIADGPVTMAAKSHLRNGRPVIVAVSTNDALAGAADSVPRSVGVCGEAAADPALAVVLTGIGVNTLSMTPRALATVGAVLASVTLAEAQELAGIALVARTAAEARTQVRSRLPVLEQLGL